MPALRPDPHGRGREGKIINVTSVHEDVPNAGGADYDCSKGAIRMLTRTLALELAPLRVNVNGLAVFLASSDADYVTGATYVMDGGLMRNLGQGA